MAALSLATEKYHKTFKAKGCSTHSVCNYFKLQNKTKTNHQKSDTKAKMKLCMWHRHSVCNFKPKTNRKNVLEKQKSASHARSNPLCTVKRNVVYEKA